MPYCWGWHVNGRCPKMMVRPFTLNSSPPHQGHAHCRAIARREREQAEEGVDGCGRSVQSSRRRLAFPAAGGARTECCAAGRDLHRRGIRGATRTYGGGSDRSEKNRSELRSIMRKSYDDCWLKEKNSH